MIKTYPSYSFNDLLLIPKYSEVSSRSLVDISVNLGKGVKLKIPVISSPMPDVSEVNMANALGELGGLTLLHRFNTIDQQVKMFSQTKYPHLVGAAVGVKEEDQTRVRELAIAGCRIICVDVAHGYSQNCGNMVSWIAHNFPNMLLIAGNVADGNGAFHLYRCGADVIRVGIGPGSICTTRIMTGNGIPSMTSLYSAFYTACQNGKYIPTRQFKILADGGLQTSGDITKSLCFSDAVILGNLLARTEESPAETVVKNEKRYKVYRGASTLIGSNAETRKANLEGVQGLVPTTGTVKNLISELMGGLKSGCSYQGATNLEELKFDPQFVQISSAGLAESKPHSLLLE